MLGGLPSLSIIGNLAPISYQPAACSYSGEKLLADGFEGLNIVLGLPALLEECASLSLTGAMIVLPVDCVHSVISSELAAEVAELVIAPRMNNKCCEHIGTQNRTE